MRVIRWFGTTWEHPEDDESKYQTFYSRAGYNPRGYGPRGSTRTLFSLPNHPCKLLSQDTLVADDPAGVTFSLTEWSRRDEVVAAWNELKDKYGLQFDPFADRDQVFGVTDSAVIGGW